MKLTRKQLFCSCREYLFCLGYELKMNNATKTQDNETIVNFTVYQKHTSKPILENISLNDCVSYIQTRIPEAFMTGYQDQDGIDTYRLFEEIHKKTEQEKRINQAIQRINGLLSALQRRI